MNVGRFRKAREVTASNVASAFFCALCGGPERLQRLRDMLDEHDTVDLDQLRHQLDEVDREVVDYLVYGEARDAGG